MRIITQLEKSRIHRETYVTILSNALKWGTKGQIARKAGISPEYLSRLQLDETPPPSLEVAERIAKSVPLPLEQQRDLYEHMCLARRVEDDVRWFAIKDDDWLHRDAVSELLRAHWLASYSENPRIAKNYYHALLDLGMILVREFYRANLPLHVSETHILLNDVLNVLNRPGEALYHAKMARAVLEAKSDYHHELVFYRYHDEVGETHVIDYPDLEINAIRIEAVSYNQFGLHPTADALLNRAMNSEAMRSRPNVWLSHILRDKVSAMGQDHTIALDDIEKEVRKGYPLHEAQDDKLGLLLIHNSLARAYMLRGKYRGAERLLLHELEQAECHKIGAPLAKTMLLNRLTTLYHHLGEREQWRHFLRQTLLSAKQGNFTKILKEISREHSTEPIYKSILGEVTSSETVS